MTDQHEPDRDLPTAGRKPPHTAGPPPADGDEPTTRLGTADLPAPGPGETTRVIGSPPDDEPTVERSRPEPGGATQRLWEAPDEPTRSIPAGRPEPPVPPAADGAPTRPIMPAAARPAQPAEGTAGPETIEAEPGQPAAGPAKSAAEPAEGAEPDAAAGDGGNDAPAVPPWRRLSSAGALIGVLLALFGFTLVVQLRSNDGDQGLATARQEDLVRILSDLEARDSRLQAEISALESSQRQLSSGVAGRQAALDEAAKRADELGLLAGTLPGRGPGLRITLDRVKASAVLNAVQELRGSGGEVMQIAGSGGDVVRVVASSYFVDAEGGGIVVDGVKLSGPYTVDVIGLPSTMQTALQIPGGVVASVNSAGGSVTMEQRSMVEVTAVRKATTLQYARPVS
jgi:uncharacterized protein YlxW (UPF0749 family)